MPISYPLDITGVAPSNLIQNEIHTITEINDFTYRIIIPSFAPFYLDNLVLEHISPLNVVTTLVRDVDYTVCLTYLGASRSIGKMLYGGLSINTEILNGTLRLTYQTLGGDWTADAQYVLERIAESNYNPRITVWDVVTNKPNQFPPTNHSLDINVTYGYQQLLEAIDSLITAIVDNQNGSSALIAHIANTNNPHGTDKVDVGLDNVENYPIATDQEVMDKAVVDKYVTLRQMVTLNLFDTTAILAALATKANISHSHTKSEIGLSDVVNYPIATTTQINNLELVNAYVTLAQVIPLIQKLVNDAVAKNNISPETLFISSNN